MVKKQFVYTKPAEDWYNLIYFGGYCYELNYRGL